MVKKHLKSVAPVVVAFLATASMILLPSQSPAMDRETVRDLASFFTHSRSDSVAMCKSDVKAIMGEMRKYVNKDQSSPEKIEERNKALDTIESKRMGLCEENVVEAMGLNRESWLLVNFLKKRYEPEI